MAIMVIMVVLVIRIKIIGIINPKPQNPKALSSAHANVEPQTEPAPSKASPRLRDYVAGFGVHVAVMSSKRLPIP